MIGYTPKGMQIAQKALVWLGNGSALFRIAVFYILDHGFVHYLFHFISMQEDMNSRNFYLLPRQGTDLLLAAAGEKVCKEFLLTSEFSLLLLCFSI